MGERERERDTEREGHQQALDMCAFERASERERARKREREREGHHEALDMCRFEGRLQVIQIVAWSTILKRVSAMVNLYS